MFGQAAFFPLAQSIRKVRWAPARAHAHWLAGGTAGGLVWLRNTSAELNAVLAGEVLTAAVTEEA